MLRLVGKKTDETRKEVVRKLVFINFGVIALFDKFLNQKFVCILAIVFQAPLKGGSQIKIKVKIVTRNVLDAPYVIIVLNRLSKDCVSK